MSSQPFFITSFIKSGSNWLRNCIDFSDKVAVSGEIYPAQNIKILENIAPGDSISQKRLTDNDAFKKAIRLAIIELMNGNFSEKKENIQLIGDKSAYSPSRNNLFKRNDHIIKISQYFPKAKQLLLIRDLRDVIVSYSKWLKGKNLLSLNPLRIAHFIIFVNKWCSMNKQWILDCKNNKQCLVIYFESMKTDFDNTIKDIYIHLGLNINDSQLHELRENYYSIDSSVYLEENRRMGYKFYRSGESGEWKKELKWFHKLIIKILANKTLHSFNYQ